MTAREEMPRAGRTDRQTASDHSWASCKARDTSQRARLLPAALTLGPAPSPQRCGQPCASPGKSRARPSAPRQPWQRLLPKALQKQLLALRSCAEHPRPGAERERQGRPGRAGTTAKPPGPRGRCPTERSSPCRNGHGSRRRSGPEGDLYSKQRMLTSAKALNGGRYSRAANRCSLIPSELFVWLCSCFSNARAAFNKTRERGRRDSTLHLPLKPLAAHFQSRAVFWGSMRISPNQ